MDEARKSDLLEDILMPCASDYPHLSSGAVCEKNGWRVRRGEGEGFSYMTVLLGSPRSLIGEKKNELSLALSEITESYLGQARSVLVSGIGNRKITPDSLGSLVCGKLVPAETENASLSSVSPGTPAQTGIDTASLIRLAAEHKKADVIIAVDSLCASGPDRLCTVIQISDYGLTPGSALSHTSGEISSKTMPCRVITIGMPTVTVSGNAMLTPAEIDVLTSGASDIIARAINSAVFSPSRFSGK